MKIERKFIIVEGIIKSCFLSLCGLFPFFYINYDTIQGYNDWRGDIIMPIIWVDVVVFVIMCLAYLFIARKDK